MSTGSWLIPPMDETDTNEVIVTATNHEHAGRLRTLQLSEVRDRWRPLSKNPHVSEPPAFQAADLATSQVML